MIMAQKEYGDTEKTIEIALKNNLKENIRKIINFSGDRPKKLLLFILHRWDIYNLKTILRGIFKNVPYKKILEGLLELGEWDIDFLTKLSCASNIDEIMDVLMSKYDIFSHNICQILKNIKKEIPLKEIEKKLDVFYYKYCFENLNVEDYNEKLILEFLKLEIDFKNIILVINSIEKQKPLDKSQIINYGNIPTDFILEISKSKSIESILKNLAEHHYKDILSRIINSYIKEKDATLIEKFLKEVVLIFANKLYIKNPLNIGVGLGYIEMKNAEIINLRNISKGLYYNLNPEYIRKNLLLC